MKIKHDLLDLIVKVDRNINCTDDEMEETYKDVVKSWEEIKKAMSLYEKIEIKAIEPVYEYQVVFKPNNNDFYITSGYFSNEQEFLNDRWNKWEFIELYLPSKRERKK